MNVEMKWAMKMRERKKVNVMSDVSPDDLTARCPECGGAGYTIFRWGPDANVDQVQCMTCPLLDELAKRADRIDALSADVARLTADRDAWRGAHDRLIQSATEAVRERDEALARVAEHAATIERLRSALDCYGVCLPSCRQRKWLRDDPELRREFRTMPRCGCGLSAVLTKTAPTPETHNG